MIATDRAEHPAQGEAAGWLARELRGLGAGERAAFQAWLAASGVNRDAYRAVRAVWDGLEQAGEDPALQRFRAEACDHAPVRRWRLRRPLAAAAVILASVGGWASMTPSSSGPDPVLPRIASKGDSAVRTFRTAIGERRIVRLEDGSIVTLNTGSELRVAYARGQRALMLVAGQALFKVAKDKTRPFIVTAGDRRVIATGTAFDVRIDRRQVRVALIEGRVRVAHRSAVAELEPGDQLVATIGGAATVGAGDITQLIGWREGRLIFSDTPLAAAVAEMNRYTVRPIRIVDPHIAGVRISGTFRSDDPLGFVAALTDYFPIEAAAGAEGIRLNASRERKFDLTLF